MANLRLAIRQLPHVLIYDNDDLSTPYRQVAVFERGRRLDEDSKDCLTQAAELRNVSVSDYVRMVTVAQARREVMEARQNTISLTPDEQLAFWQALSEPAQTTPAQRELGRMMRGEA
jgi:uncharacterized protein (DUF1778 family)